MTPKNPDDRYLYIFLDEAGNFDFSKNGTQYFTITALSRIRPFSMLEELMDLKYNLWEDNVEFEYFHASEDKQHTRTCFFNILRDHLDDIRADSVIVEKSKTNPTLQNNHAMFYKKMFDILLRYVLEAYRGKYDVVIIVTDTIPLKQKRKDIEKAIKTTVSEWMDVYNCTYQLFHLSSKSDINLQIADYINWAIYIKWQRQERRSYEDIRKCLISEYDVFLRGTTRYY